MASDPLLQLDNQLCFALYAASNAMTRRYRDRLAELGLTYPQYLVMMVLWEGSPRSVKAIGEQLRLDSGTLTPMLKRMEATGLLTRRRDAADERQVNIELTAQGRALQRKAAAMAKDLFCSLPLDPKEIARLRDEVRRLGDVLHQAEPN